MIVTEKEAEAFLEEVGFPVIRRSYCMTLKECEKAAHKIGYPVAMKVASSKIMHKSDVGGVILNLMNPSMVKKAFKHMMRIRHAEGVMVQEYLTGDFLLLGLKKDPTFGHTVAVGAGGIYTEVLKDVSFRICPFTLDDARDMLKELKIYPIIRGLRGGKDMRQHVHALLLKLSQLAQDYPMITELDINPLIIHHHGVTVADARIVVDADTLA